MTEVSTRDEVCEVIAVVLGVDVAQLEGARMGELEGSDSFGHVPIVLALEEELDLTIRHVEMMLTRNVDDIVVLIDATRP